MSAAWHQVWRTLAVICLQISNLEYDLTTWRKVK